MSPKIRSRSGSKVNTTKKGSAKGKPKAASQDRNSERNEDRGNEDRGNKGGTDQRPKAGRAPMRAKVPFPRKNQPPSETEFLARLPLATGKKFETVRVFLRKQKGVGEDLYYYGPKTGWAFRYLRGVHSLATVMIHDNRLMGIISLDASALTAIDFGSLSDVGQRARRMAHGSPSLLWLDLPLDGSGAADFRALLKAKLKALPPPGPPRPPPPPPPPTRP